MKSYQILPAEQRIVVLPDEKEERRTSMGIILPQTSEEDRPETGVIVAVGKGDIDNPMKYLVGQRVIFSQYAGLSIRINFDKYGEHIYKVMNQADIIGQIKEIN